VPQSMASQALSSEAEQHRFTSILPASRTVND
jgi:hypothetical protein